MDLLKIHSTYQRAGTDDVEQPSTSPPDYELSDYWSIRKFTSGKLNPPAREYGSEYQLLEDSNTKSISDRKRSKWVIRFEGWRTGASTAAVLALISMCINLVVALWLASMRKNSAIVEVYNGDCETVARADIWVHLAINILSTLLLSGSNFCMQCVSAPTRIEIDRFHKKGKYLDIGVPSIRNLRAVPVFKVALWWALGLSSIPLHLMYNSAFFKSLVTNGYNVVTVTEDFVSGTSFNNSWYDTIVATSAAYSYQASAYVDAREVQGNISNYVKLSPRDCLEAYAVPFLSDKRQLALVVNQDVIDLEALAEMAIFSSPINVSTRGEDPLVFQHDVEEAQSEWICQSVPNASNYLEEAFGSGCDANYRQWLTQMENWRPWGQEISHCLYETIPERCSYSANILIISVVIISNFIKLICMYIVATRLHDAPLITIGDALESFLNYPDPTTRNMCLLNRSKIRAGAWNNALSEHESLPATATRVPVRWLSAATPLRWLTTLFFFTTALITVLALFIKSRTGPAFRPGTPSIMTLGLGRIHPTTLIEAWGINNIESPPTQVLAAVLVANLPQTILSFLHLHLNGLATSMWLAAEYADFAHERKTLRVSSAKGAQRSKHFLQLPYKIALPLMAGSGVLHWLVSQSIFLAVVAKYGVTGELVSVVDVATCGYSPLGMILTMMLGLVLMMGTVAVGWFRRLKGGMPLAGSCSAAISAACHRPEWDREASLKEVMWGVIRGDGVGEEDFAHCSFSSGNVEPVEEGKMYAGLVSRRGRMAVDEDADASKASDARYSVLE